MAFPLPRPLGRGKGKVMVEVSNSFSFRASQLYNLLHPMLFTYPKLLMNINFYSNLIQILGIFFVEMLAKFVTLFFFLNWTKTYHIVPKNKEALNRHTGPFCLLTSDTSDTPKRAKFQIISNFYPLIAWRLARVRWSCLRIVLRL